MKIGIGKKLLANFYDKKEHIVDKYLKQGLNYGLVLKKVHKIIKFNQKALLKPYVKMNTELRKNAKNNFEIILMNNAVFEKAMENVRKNEDIKLLTLEARRNYLVSEPNYDTTKGFSKDLLAMEKRR